MLNGLPRVLIVSDTPFSDYHGAGVTLTTLFDGWPADRLAMFCSAWSPMLRMPSQADRCAHVRPFRLPGPGGRLDWVKHRAGLSPAWRHSLSRAWHQRWFGRWRPDVVYSMFLELNTFGYADWISTLLNVPHICHITDDISKSIDSFGLDRLRRGVARAVHRLAISDEMKQQYESLLGADFLVCHNGASDAALAPPAYAGSDELVIRYLGSVSIVQHGALAELAGAVRLARTRGIPCRLDIVGSFWDEQLDASFVDGTAVRRVGPYVSRVEWSSLMTTADLLVIPVSFGQDDRQDVRLSLPTKLLEYLCTGTPVLIYGPADAAPAAFCRRHGLGWRVDRPGAELLVQFLRGCRPELPAMRERAMRDRVRVQAEFSNHAITAKFQRLLIDVANAA